MANLPINGLDLAVGIVLLISTLLAFMRGVVHEVLSVAAWVGAVIAVVQGQPYVRPFARSIIPIDRVADSAAAIIIFLVVLLVLSILTNAVSRRVQKSALNNLDRSLGFVFGIGRALVILAIWLIITDWVTARRPGWMATAKTLPVIELTADGLKAVVPASFLAAGDTGKDGAATLNRALDAKENLAKETLERLTAPAPQSEPDATKSDGGYQDKDRRTLDSLIDRTNEDQTTAPSGGKPAGGNQ